MKGFNIYLNFDGNCMEAFTLYQEVFGGDYGNISRFSEMPPSEEYPVPESDMDKIMHIDLPLGAATLMGCDYPSNMEPRLKVGNNYSISLETDSREEADRVFKALSEGGMVKMPMADSFWGAYFGALTDKFGVHWMVSYGTPLA